MIFKLVHEQARQNAVQAVLDAPEGYQVRITEPRRNLDQNAAQWPILQAFSNQLEWPVNGHMCKLEPEEWKNILTAAYKRETVRIAQGLDGGNVMLGVRTSKMGKKEFSNWLEFLHATAIDRDVKL